jgi:hypothetical protein
MVIDAAPLAVLFGDLMIERQKSDNQSVNQFNTPSCFQFAPKLCAG